MQQGSGPLGYIRKISQKGVLFCFSFSCGLSAYYSICKESQNAGIDTHFCKKKPASLLSNSAIVSCVYTGPKWVSLDHEFKMF